MPSQRESKPDRMARADACEKELVQKAHQQWARDAIRDRKAAEARERRLMVQLKREKLNTLETLTICALTEVRGAESPNNNEGKLDAIMELIPQAKLATIRMAEEAAVQERQEAEAARAAAAEERRLAEEAIAALQEAQLATRRVRMKLQGRFSKSVNGGAVAPSPEPPLAEVLPIGCRLLEGAIYEWEAVDAVGQLDKLFRRRPRDCRVAPITAGQADLKRVQAKLGAKDAAEFPILNSFTRALEEAGEAKGRILSEFNAIESQPTCMKQERHWDYDPTLVRYDAARRCRRSHKDKPRSAILGLQPGARLYVYEPVLRRDVTVLVPVGAILLFDGDVAHAGACYAAPNTRVHVYLDVAGVQREKDVTWFEE